MRRSTALTGPSYSMLLGMWTTAATFYGLVFVDFPSLRAARAADRPQHGALRRADAGPGAGAAAARGRRRGAPSLTMPRLAAWVQRHRTRDPRGAACRDVRARARRDAACGSTRRSIGCKSVTPAARAPGSRSRRCSACRARSMSFSTRGRTSQPLLDDERAAGRRARDGRHADARPSAGDRAAAVRSDAGAGGRRDRRSAGMSPTAVDARRSQAARGRRLSRPTRSIRSASALPRLLDAAAAPDLSTDYIAHGLGDLVDRFVSRRRRPAGARDVRVPGDRRAGRRACRRGRRGRSIAATLTGLPLVNRELSRQLPAAVHPRPRDRHADRRGHRGLGVSRLVAVAARAAADRDRPGLGRRAAGARRRRSWTSSRCSRS